MTPAKLVLSVLISIGATASIAWSSEKTELADFTVLARTPLEDLGPSSSSTLWRLERPDGVIFEMVSIVAASSATVMSIKPTLTQGGADDLFTPATCPGAKVVTNGSFYLKDGRGWRPLGLVRVAGNTIIAPSKRKTGGFLAISKGVPRILARSEVNAALLANDAIESSPIVESGGRSAMRSDDGIRFDRVGIGVLENDRIAVVGAFGDDQDTVSLVEFGRLARAGLAAQGGTLVDLIALDGGPSAHIYLPGTGKLFGFRGPIYLPNTVCLAGR